jgi:hypothetical protein
MLSGLPHSFSATRAWRVLPVLACCLSAVGLVPTFAVSPSPVAARAQLYGSGWPLFFEPGVSGSDIPSHFRARGPNYQLFVSPAEVNFVLRKSGAAPSRDSVRREDAASARGVSARALRLSFLSANPLARMYGAGEMEGKVNYLLGNDAAGWRTQVPMFGSVRVQALYPGIDLVYYGNQGQFEYDFTVAPHADPAAITFHFEGPDRLSVGPDGELVVGLDDTELR